MSSVACRIRCTTADQNLIERICPVESTPVLSSYYRRLSKMVSDAPADPVQLAAVIEERPSFTAKLLKLANAAYYAPAAKVDCIDAVIEVMGAKGTVDMVLAMELVKAFGLPKDIDIERYWDHAVAVATLSEELATHNQLDGETAYTIGLLHDVGLLQMARFAPDDFKFLMSQLGPEETLYEMMPRLFGVFHFDFSIALIERWDFDRRHSEPLVMVEDTNGDRRTEVGQLSLLLRQAHAIAHDNKYAFYWDRIPEVASDSLITFDRQPDFASGIGAALLACCYK